jgi:PAS domain S-box-containing protein
VERQHGPRVSPTLGGESPVRASLAARWFRALYESPLLYSGILDGEGRVLDANLMAIEGCGLARDRVIGRSFWDCGWWSPDREVSDRVRDWTHQAIVTRKPLRTRSRYFLGDGTARTVDLSLHPVHEDDAHGTFVVTTGVDVTDAVRAQAEREQRLAVETTSIRQVALARAQELETVRQAEYRAAERLRSLADVGSALGEAETVEDLTDIVIHRGVPVIGADGGAVTVRSPQGLTVAASDRLGTRTTLRYGRLPLNSPLPAAYVARTGRPLVLPDRAAGLAFAPETAQLYEETQRGAWAFAPLRLGGRVLGSLAVSWAEERRIAADEMGLVQAFAAQCAQALGRIQATQAQREATLRVQRVRESLQRSLLTRPPITDRLDVAVRYLPAQQETHVGGDWYDAFAVPRGATVVCVGDVADHDGDAAATMAQLRNLLRGLAADSHDGPATLLSRLDAAIARLGLAGLATAVVAVVQPDPSPGAGCRVRWSSAGHLPPLVRLMGGGVHVLPSSDDLLLGLDAGAARAEHVTDLPGDSTLVLCTDGLVERRGEGLDEGLGRLVSALDATGSAAPEEVCDRLLGALLERAPDDDVALLVLRARPSADAATGG